MGRGTLGRAEEGESSLSHWREKVIRRRFMGGEMEAADVWERSDAAAEVGRYSRAKGASPMARESGGTVRAVTRVMVPRGLGLWISRDQRCSRYQRTVGEGDTGE